MKRLLAVLSCLVAGVAHGQIVIEGNAIAAAEGTIMVISTDEDMTNNSTFDFSPLDLRLSLFGEFKNINGNWSLSHLNMEGGLITLNGNVSVSSGMNFTSGVLRVPDDFKLLFTGDGNNVIYNATTPGVSYIDGTFYQAGTGPRKFPVGDGTLALPLTFLDVKTPEEVGITAVASSSGIHDFLSVKQVDDTRHWIIETNNAAAINSRVTLYTTGNSLPEGGTVVVIESDPIDLDAIWLGNDTDGKDNVAISKKEVSKPLLALGRTDEVDIKIRDLITPYDAGKPGNMGNDAIYVENLFPDNRVVLMDRWGVVLKEWKNYDNEDESQIAFFQTLSPGNYICIVECIDSENNPIKKTQMVTVLKTN